LIVGHAYFMKIIDLVSVSLVNHILSNSWGIKMKDTFAF
jgi:hypothetical protein